MRYDFYLESSEEPKVKLTERIKEFRKVHTALKGDTLGGPGSSDKGNGASEPYKTHFK